MPLSTRETVWWETPARSATSLIRGTRGRSWEVGLMAQMLGGRHGGIVTAWTRLPKPIGHLEVLRKAPRPPCEISSGGIRVDARGSRAAQAIHESHKIVALQLLL